MRSIPLFQMDLCRTCGYPLGKAHEVMAALRDDLERAAGYIGRVEHSDAYVKDVIFQQVRTINCYLDGTHCSAEAAMPLAAKKP